MLRSARLVAGDVRYMPCEGSAAASSPSLVVGDTPVATTRATPAEPGSEQAIALARKYLALLDQGHWPEAYALLAPSYQARMPLQAYTQGYAPVRSVELLGLSVVRLDDQTESAQALLRITAQQVDRLVVGDWLAEMTIIAAPGDAPLDRVISDVGVRRVLIDE